MLILERVNWLIKKGVKDNIFPAIEKITILGFIPWKKNYGWISISNEPKKIHISLTNNKRYHNRVFGAKAYGIDIDKKTGKLHQLGNWTGAWKSAIGMHPVYDANEARIIEEHMHKAINAAYSWAQSR